MFGPHLFRFRISAIALTLLLTAATGFSQSFAVIAPDRSADSGKLVVSLETGLRQAGASVIDSALASSAFRAVSVENPYNLSTYEARNIGSSIGTRFFVILKNAIQRRSTSERHEYYDGYAAIYLVSSVSGELSDWMLVKFEEDTPELARKKLEARLAEPALRIVSSARSAIEREAAAEPPKSFPQYSEDEKDVRPPLPYRRLKPKYTQLADLYSIAATVDVEVDIDAEGRVARISIARWAGFGLDESVERTIREMQWRPADRKGKTLPMRILLRYNFRDLINEEN